MTTKSPTSGSGRRAALAAARLAEARAARRRRQLIIGVGVLVGALVLTLVGWKLFGPKPTVPVVGTPAHAVEQTGIQIPGPAAKTGAPHLVVYSDFQCPWCARYHENLGAEFDRLVAAGEITMEHRALFSLGEQLGNDSSTRAAEAAACADLPGVDRFPQALSALYAAQPVKEGDGFSAQTLREKVPAAAGIKGAALNGYQRCLDDRAMLGFVQAVDTAGRVSLRAANPRGGTPTYVINGKVLDLSPLFNQTTKTFDPTGLAELIKKSA